jgi:hypothetical protein
MTDKQLESISFALEKQAPSIEREAVFQTDYGELRFFGEDAQKIAKAVRKILVEQLVRAKEEQTKGKKMVLDEAWRFVDKIIETEDD